MARPLCAAVGVLALGGAACSTVGTTSDEHDAAPLVDGAREFGLFPDIAPADASTEHTTAADMGPPDSGPGDAASDGPADAGGGDGALDGPPPDGAAPPDSGPIAPDTAPPDTAPTADSGLCPLNYSWCAAIGFCIPNGSCCSNADCPSPQSCNQQTGNCGCEGLYFASCVGVPQICSSGWVKTCQPLGACGAYEKTKQCTHGCGVGDSCKRELRFTAMVTPCKRDSGDNWDIFNPVGNTEPPDPYILALGTKGPMQGDGCASHSLASPFVAGVFDPALVSVIPVTIWDADANNNEDDLMCQGTLNTTVVSSKVKSLADVPTYTPCSVSYAILE